MENYVILFHNIPFGSACFGILCKLVYVRYMRIGYKHKLPICFFGLFTEAQRRGIPALDIRLYMLYCNFMSWFICISCAFWALTFLMGLLIK